MISDTKSCSDVFRKLIMSKSTKKAEENDKFNMFSDDTLQRDKFNKKPNGK